MDLVVGWLVVKKYLSSNNNPAVQETNVKMEVSTEPSPQKYTTMTDLPDKILAKILSYIPAKDIQPKRIICSKWSRAIETEFGVQIFVKNENYRTMLACSSATTAKFSNFTVPFTEDISFSRTLTSAEFVGEIGRSNIVQLLTSCSNIDHLQFTNIFFVDVYSPINFDGTISLPLTHLKIIVSFFQDKLCMAELIIIDLLTRIRIALTSITIHTEDPMSTVRFRFMPPPDEDFPDDDLDLEVQDIREPQQQDEEQQRDELRRNILMLALPAATEHDNPVGREDAADNTPEDNFPPELLHEPGVHNFVVIGMNMWEDGLVGPVAAHQGPNIQPNQAFPVPSDIFTELLLQNRGSLQTFITNFAEFTCLGDISHWNENRLREIQLENVCYSFGGTRDDNGEYLLLRNQHSLKYLEMFMLHDDLDSENFWQDVTRAIQSSYQTLNNVELTIFTEHEWIVDLGIFSTCNHLTKLIFNHYSRKTGIETLPTSIELLKLNGTLNRNQCHSIAHRLVNLKIFEFHLNMEGDPLDMEFLVNILRCPNLQKVSLFACPMGQPEHDFLRNIPGLTTREEFAFNMENCLVLITVGPNFQRSSLVSPS